MSALNDLYSAICSELHLTPNTYISQGLKDTGECGSLKGNSRQVIRLTDEDVKAVSKTLRNHLHVKALDLRYNRISDEGAVHLADLLQENVALQELDLMGNNIGAEGAEQIARSLHHNTSLKKLRMTGNKIQKKGALHFASMLQINSTLEDLDVSDCDLDTQSLITFAIALSNSSSLVSINVSRPLLFSLQEETTCHMARMLKVNHSLRELHMGKHNMTDSGVQRLCEALISNHSLHYLDLRCNKITRDGARHLAGLLRQNGTLQILDLSFNRIENEGTVCLSEAIAMKHTKLSTLSIQSNNVSTVGLLSLSQAITANPHLTHVYIWGNRLEEPVCVAFSQLISSNRVSAQNTDVTPYTVDGHVHLAQVSNGLQLHYY
ncbi:leucine-rich repeat-containing protein 34 isoform X1 [Silurus meridionalis]|nr:leucine-rich repeat-containing protein 34 isoform X1 [Silurus meridionalis]